MTIDSGVFWVRVPKILIGKGAVDNIGALVKQLGSKNALIVTDPGIVQSGLVDRVTQPLEKEGIRFGIYDGCKPDAPLSAIKSAAQFVAQGAYDLIIGIGGGSVMDTVKVVSLLAKAKNIAQVNIQQYFAEISGRGLPTILIASTAGTGAEVSPGAVVTDDLSGAQGVKKVIVNDYTMPEVAIVDPSMTCDLPPRMTADTGMDALSHAIEAYTHARANLVSDMFAETTVRLVGSNLRSAFHKGSLHLEARYNMAVAAALGIIGFVTAGGPHLTHGIAHSVQAKVHCTHGMACSVMLPWVMEFNMPACLPRLARIAELMGENTEGLSLREAAKGAIDAVRNLSSDVGMPQRLRDLGLKKEGIGEVVDILLAFNVREFGNNPRDCSKDEATSILQAAW
jgi:alcohol dehydrogenase class IV